MGKDALKYVPAIMVPLVMLWTVRVAVPLDTKAEHAQKPVTMDTTVTTVARCVSVKTAVRVTISRGAVMGRTG